MKKPTEETVSDVAIKGPHVLIVDDGVAMRLFYRSVLEPAGFQVEEAVNGVEGYEKVLSRRFDLLIVDINMPKMDGYSMLQIIRRDTAVGVPALVISTEEQKEDMLRAYEAGANFYLVKPAIPETLCDVARLMTGMPS